MTMDPRQINDTLGVYRAYLETLSYIQIDPRLRSKIARSEVIQDTLVEAFRDLDRIQAMDEASRRRWLRRMLLNNLRDHVDHWLADGRDVKREQALEVSAQQSSARLQDWLAAEGPSPSAHAQAIEQMEQVVQALAGLNERQRQAIILQRWHGWKLSEIAEHLSCTAGAVAGLLAHGVARLRELCPDVAP
jgi:RNA polymerase sigma-70 factor (subfamily 1)